MLDDESNDPVDAVEDAVVEDALDEDKVRLEPNCLDKN